jgi:transcriptional regulator with XRE-family HTH domain
MRREMDVSALYGALDSKRSARKMSWRQLAEELGLSASIFSRLARGRRPDFDSYIQMTEWLGVPLESFVGGEKPAVTETEETVAAIAAHLRADEALKPASAKAIEKIVQAAYDEMAEN